MKVALIFGLVVIGGFSFAVYSTQGSILADLPSSLQSNSVLQPAGIYLIDSGWIVGLVSVILILVLWLLG